MTDSLNLQNEPVTQDVFDRLPALLTRYQVQLVTGFDDRELAEAVKDKQLRIYRGPVRKGCKHAYAKYTKTSVAKIVGFKI